MTIYTAKKPCKFGGKKFKIGDNIPAEMIAIGRTKALIEYGVISATTVDDVVDTNVTENTSHDDQQPDLAPETEGSQPDSDAEQTDTEASADKADCDADDQQPEPAAEKPKAASKKGAKK